MSALPWTIYATFLGALLVTLLPAGNLRHIRFAALGTALVGLFIGLYAAANFDAAEGLVTLSKHKWIPAFGAEYHLAADGISVVMVLLTGIAAVTGVLFSWNVMHRLKEFFAFFLLLIGAVYGVFLSFDLFLFFVFYELAIVPKYFLVAIWGGQNREYAAMKLVLYSFVGSALVMVGIVATLVVSGGQTASLEALGQIQFAASFQHWVFPLMFVGFTILAGLWPFHTWAPTGHVAAPTAASMLLAGVIMKLGAYGAMRAGVCLFPEGLIAWQDVLGWLAVIGIVYGASVALVQKDFKFVIGYSSVSHMGFVILGLVSMNAIGLAGAILQMFSHGIIAGLLFGVVGRMVYERAHTRDLNALQVMNLGKALPFAAGTFVLASLASMGLPGFSGFVAEFSVLIGVWAMDPTKAVVAGVGIVIGVAFTLRALQAAFFSDAGPVTDKHHEEMEPITVPERVGALILLATTLIVGLYPKILLDFIQPALASPLFDALRKGGLQ
ncbi:MAG: complex I subunit 4 family protein [Verrucomicrobiota bacterium]